MSVASPNTSNRIWPFVWLFVAIIVIPYVTTRVIGILFPELSSGWLVLVWMVTVGLGLYFWVSRQGGGWRKVERDSTVIIWDPTQSSHVVVEQGRYWVLPMIHKVVARLPNYSFRFEPTIENIDTQTPMLAKISKIRVRLDCKIKVGEHLTFLEKSASRLDLLKNIQQEKKLDRTDHALWKEFLDAVIKELVDDSVRDVVWNWSDQSTNDPTSLSRQRQGLAQQVEAHLEVELNAWGLELIPFLSGASPAGVQQQSSNKNIVLESIEIDPELIKRKTADRDKEKEKAKHEAALLATAIREKGFAEAEVRATTLAKLLDVLINEYKIPHTDPLIAQVVRAALYSDGQTIWNAMMEKGAPGPGDGKAKTA